MRSTSERARNVVSALAGIDIIEYRVGDPRKSDPLTFLLHHLLLATVSSDASGVLPTPGVATSGRGSDPNYSD